MRGAVSSIVADVMTGAALPTVAVSTAGAPSSSPSFGVTVTVTVWPLSPLSVADRSKESLNDAVPEVTCRVVPSTFHS